MSEPQKQSEPSVKPGDTTAPAASNPDAPQLSKEEQWALFEKELKENDWGHQPC